MQDGLHVPRSSDEFATYQADVMAVLDLTSRLPDLPFRISGDEIRIAQFGHLLGTGFAPVLAGLADDHGDAAVTLAVVEPKPSYYIEQYSHFPAVRLERAALSERYWEGISFEPSGDPTGAIAYTADVVAIAGATRGWAVWGQRDWDLILIGSTAPAGPWADTSVPFVSAEEAVRDFTFGSRAEVSLAEPEIAALLRNLEAYGAGR
jgi:hypothetical protein